MKQTTGEFLETLRKASGFTQLEVAEKLGVSNRTVSSWETDRTAPDLLILPAIADLYKVTVDEILRGERKAAAERGEEISEKAKRDLRKRRYAKYGTRRAFCLGFGLLGSLIFLAACAVLLYSSAPLWLSVVLMVLGAGGCISCVILLACFAFSAERSEGIVLKEDYTEENKPYVQCVRHSTANSLFWLSLPHIAGVIVFLIVFFAMGYYDYSIIVGNVTVSLDYTTPTVTLVCLNAVFALAFIISGIVLNLTGIFGLGTAEQKSKVKANGKLLGKICGFGAIPVVIALVLMIVFCLVTPTETKTVYFEAKSREEVYKNFQTLKTGDITAEQDDGSFKVIVPAGEYYLDFQSDSGVRLSGVYYNVDDTYFYELGNGFYGRWYGRWKLYYLKSGVSAEDIVEKEDYSNYLEELWGSYEKISVFVGDEYFFVTNVAYDEYSEIVSDNWDYPYNADGTRFYGYKLRYVRTTNYHEREGVFRYEGYFLYDYSFPFIVTFWCTVGATVIAGTISYFVKRKKTEYTF